MSANSIFSDDEVLEHLSAKSPWLKDKIMSDTGLLARSATRDITEVRVDIKLYSNDDLNGKVEDVYSWTPADLYMYSEAPFVELANTFGDLESQCRELQRLAADPIDFELRTIDLWQQVKSLNQFLRISNSHDELIASLMIMSVESNGVLNDSKLKALVEVFAELANAISIDDERLDKIYDTLEAAGFELNKILV